jgi:chromosome segregation ATPase
MTNEDIERNLQLAADRLVEHSKLHQENERLLAAILKSQERFEKNLSHHEEWKREMEKIASRHAVIIERLDIRHEQYVENFNFFMMEMLSLKQQANQTNGRLDRVEANIERLSEAQIKTDESLKHLAGAHINTHGRLNKVEDTLNRLAEAQIKTDEQIRALAQSSLMPRPTNRARKSSKK